jgi:hypothetical protein
VYVCRSSDGVDIVRDLTALQVKSLMTQGQVKALNVLVEDECGAAILREILRRIDQDFVRSVGIHTVGGAENITTTMRTLGPLSSRMAIAAVLDGDKKGSPSENTFVLPGSRAPEFEMFASASVKGFLHSRYGVNLDDFRAGLYGTNHHDWFGRLAESLTLDKRSLMGELAQAYVAGLPEPQAFALTKQLKEATRQ